MKATIYNIKGEKKTEIELPKVFSANIREDIVTKYANASRYWHPHTLNPRAGRKASASGTVSHRRHEWKGHYGKGISRVPRKTMWRRGVQFSWVGAEVSGTRKGRRVHGPTIKKELKINKKEKLIALNSAIAATANESYIAKRYSSVEKPQIKFPIIIELENNVKVKNLINSLKNIFGDLFYLVLKHKQVRAGKGKSRGRKYKSNAGLLIITGKDEKIKLSGIDVRKVNELSILDLYPLGRLVVYTENALKELEAK